MVNLTEGSIQQPLSHISNRYQTSNNMECLKESMLARFTTSEVENMPSTLEFFF